MRSSSRTNTGEGSSRRLSGDKGMGIPLGCSTPGVSRIFDSPSSSPKTIFKPVELTVQAVSAASENESSARLSVVALSVTQMVTNLKMIGKGRTETQINTSGMRNRKALVGAIHFCAAPQKYLQKCSQCVV